MNKELLFFASIFAAAIALDALKFLVAGKPTVVNWESIVHPAWVIGAIVMLFLSTRFPLIHRIAFWVYLVIFVLAYLDIYFERSETLTYFCMLFNLVLVAVIFFARPSLSETK